MYCTVTRRAARQRAGYNIYDKNETGGYDVVTADEIPHASYGVCPKYKLRRHVISSARIFLVSGVNRQDIHLLSVQ